MKNKDLHEELEHYKKLLAVAETRANKAEEALQESRYSFAQAEKISGSGHWSLDLKTGKVSWSAGHYRIFAYQEGVRNDFHNMFRERVHPDDIDSVDRVVKIAISNNQPYGVDYRVVLPDGSIRYIHEEADRPSVDEHGQRITLFGIVKDITDRKMAEISLSESQVNLARAETIASIGYFDWDMELKKINCSEGLLRILNLPEDKCEYDYKTILSSIHPEDLPEVEKIILEVVRGGGTASFNFRLIQSDGTLRYAHAEADRPAIDIHGRPVKLFGIIQDITRHRQAEEALHLSEVKYRNIVETANEGICIIDEKSQIIFANEKILRMTGYTLAEALGQDVYQFVCPDYRDIMKRNLITRQSSLTEQIDYKLKRKDGTAMWVIASSSPIYSGDGKFMGILAMLNDITDRKRADEQLKASLNEKEALLKEIHHRVKNNLQIISSLLNLQSSVITDEKYKELLMDSQNRIKSMALLHELLYKSKDLSSINLSEYITSLTRYISRSYQRYSGHATLHTDVENIPIDIEKAINVGIIVTEIVSNSIKYAFPGDRTGDIRVGLHRQGQDIVLTITDNGIGLPEGMDIQNTPTLGLQLVDILTQQLGGTLEIGRRDPTSFTIRFKESVRPN